MDSYALIGPLLRALPPEAAHRLTVRALAAGLAPAVGADAAAATGGDPRLRQALWGLDFANPVGLAAGFDKDAEAVAPLLGLGFGFVEVGTVTPRPQPGNPRPRLFRLPEDGAVINRMGFNGGGMEAAAARLMRFRAAAPGGAPAIVGVNLGKNRDSADAAADYAAVAARLAPYASYLVVNVSSPNTPGLRALQDRAALTRIVGAVRGAIPADMRPLLVKIAPDLGEEDRADLARLALDLDLDGLIVGNTTVSRPDGLAGRHRAEAGGLSGRPLMALSTAVLGDLYRRTEGRVPLVGTGGIASGRDAYAKIRAGASLVQLYTALVFAGPALVGAICRDLGAALAADGFASVREAVGADHR